MEFIVQILICMRRFSISKTFDGATLFLYDEGIKKWEFPFRFLFVGELDGF